MIEDDAWVSREASGHGIQHRGASETHKRQHRWASGHGNQQREASEAREKLVVKISEIIRDLMQLMTDKSNVKLREGI